MLKRQKAKIKMKTILMITKKRLLKALKRNVLLKTLENVKSQIVLLSILRKLAKPIVNMDLVPVRAFANTVTLLSSVDIFKPMVSVTREKDAK